MFLKLAPIFATILFLISVPAHAKKSIEDTLGGTIIMSKKAFPKTLKSASSVKKLHQSKFAYDKDGYTVIRYLVFLKKAIPSVSSDITLLDITEGFPGKVVQTSSFFISERGQRIYASNLKLDESQIRGDRKYRLVFSHKGYVIAKGDFFIKAKPVIRSGKVDFTEEEASGKKKK